MGGAMPDGRGFDLINQRPTVERLDPLETMLADWAAAHGYTFACRISPDGATFTATIGRDGVTQVFSGSTRRDALRLAGTFALAHGWEP